MFYVFSCTLHSHTHSPNNIFRKTVTQNKMLHFNTCTVSSLFTYFLAYLTLLCSYFIFNFAYAYFYNYIYSSIVYFIFIQNHSTCFIEFFHALYFFLVFKSDFDIWCTILAFLSHIIRSCFLYSPISLFFVSLFPCSLRTLFHFQFLLFLFIIKGTIVLNYGRV